MADNPTYEELEKKVKELEKGAVERMRTEEALKKAQEKVNIQLLETNQALRVLARNIDKDKEALENRIYEIVSSKIMPIAIDLKEDKSCRNRKADLEVLVAHLNILISDSSQHLEIDTSLSDQEMRIAVMIKNGLTSQKIANMLYVSLDTIKTHRKNIRKKLKVQNSKVNLTSYFNGKCIDSGQFKY